MDKPKTSIAMAVYNGERFLPEQLDSLLRQTRLPDELVVSDDASTDATVEVVREFATHAPFPVKLIPNDQNVGCTKNYDRAIGQCTGEIIFMCDCDDVWHPERIAVTEETFAAYPRAGAAICDADLIDEQSRPLGRRLWESRDYQCSANGVGCIEQTTFDRTIPSYGPTVVFHGRFKPLVLPLPDGPHFRITGQDTFIAWCIFGSGAGTLALINAPLLSYRQHATQMTKQFEQTSLPRWKARTERPLTKLSPLIERLESDVARAASVNHKMREAALRHWRSRCFLPSSKLRRIPIVMREYASGRYSEFSDGWQTAVKDLLFVR
jgi:hypothetical protein